MKYDLIVIGAGPAGSTTARFAALNGLNVLIMDRKREIGKESCGGFLPSVSQIMEILPSVNDLASLFSIEENVVSRRTKRIVFVSPRGKEYAINFSGFSVNRKEFDNYLSKKAENAGADVLLGTGFISLRGEEVRTEKGIFQAKVVAGADGHYSRVARCVSLPSNRKMAIGVVCEVDGDFGSDVRMYFGSIAPKGYAWIIPKKEGANIGLGVQDRGLPLKKLLRNFLIKLEVDTKSMWKVHTGWVPLNGPLSKTVKGNVLLVGDAAGHVMATNGGGIPIGMVCGRIAGNVAVRHVKDGAPLQTYEKEWRMAVGKELKIALRTKRIADLFAFRNDSMTEWSMSILGSKGLAKAVKCKKVFW